MLLADRRGFPFRGREALHTIFDLINLRRIAGRGIHPDQWKVLERASHVLGIGDESSRAHRHLSRLRLSAHFSPGLWNSDVRPARLAPRGAPPDVVRNGKSLSTTAGEFDHRPSHRSKGTLNQKFIEKTSPSIAP